MASFGLMVLFELVFWGITIAVIVKAIRRSRDKRGEIKRSEASRDNTVYGGSGQYAGRPAGNAEYSGQRVSQSKTAGKPINSANRLDEKPENMSTTQYLQKKADLDTQEHAREDLEAQQQLMRETGGAGVGERPVEGTSCGPDKMRVRCRYCGADNLLPRNVRSKYTCYFCREFL